MPITAREPKEKPTLKPVLSASNAPNGFDDMRFDAVAEDEESVVVVWLDEVTGAVVEVGADELAGLVD